MTAMASHKTLEKFTQFPSSMCPKRIISIPCVSYHLMKRFSCYLRRHFRVFLWRRRMKRSQVLIFKQLCALLSYFKVARSAIGVEMKWEVDGVKVTYFNKYLNVSIQHIRQHVTQFWEDKKRWRSFIGPHGVLRNNHQFVPRWYIFESSSTLEKLFKFSFLLYIIFHTRFKWLFKLLFYSWSAKSEEGLCAIFLKCNNYKRVFWLPLS
jgi:hypothetical protein